jgi:hypothetical protein
MTEFGIAIPLWIEVIVKAETPEEAYAMVMADCENTGISGELMIGGKPVDFDPEYSKVEVYDTFGNEIFLNGESYEP